MYAVGFSRKRGDRGFQTGRAGQRWGCSGVVLGVVRHCRGGGRQNPPAHNMANLVCLETSVSSLMPVSGSLEEDIAGQSLREAERCKRDGKTSFCAKLVRCCNRSAQEKYQEFVPVPVWISLENLN